MIAALEKYMPKDQGLRWTNPDGGLFIFVWMPEGIDTTEMLSSAIEKKVAYVPGASSYVDGGGQNTLRLAFSLSTPEQIDEGIKRFAEVVSDTLRAHGE